MRRMSEGPMLRKPRPHLLLGLLVLALMSGCATGATGPAPGNSPAVAGCQYKLDATVRAGAHSGLNLRGRLTLVQQAPDDLVHAVGLVVPDGAAADAAHAVPVQAQLASPAITLTFTLPDG